MSAQRPADGPARDGHLHAWAELLRAPAAFTVPGDVLAGTAAAGTRPTGRTALAAGASLCLYEAGMALNDWADREEDATVWAYDLGLKHTPAGPAAMAAARSLDLLLGAAAGPGAVRRAIVPAAFLGSHTLAVSLVSRRETEGGSSTAPLTALAAAGALTTVLAGRPTAHPAPDASTGAPTPATPPADKANRAVRAALAASYAATFARPLAHAALNPSPELTQRAVGAGVRATIALQSGLMARAGAPGTGVLTAALAPLAAHLARKVSTT
ncbi:prenyltransferase [Streptomyces vinaceusdrappus]|uniref:Prenyltransferase n=1 Tax=Streptomyces vinaceusdrappus TaxID=67376 RepID=A0ABY6C876_9ACTN|nr:prenyltransferase [Streptomyces vinaceusdrappus]UXI82880.1 prenyltransferase [Streptomyces vinaceusdrappus]